MNAATTGLAIIAIVGLLASRMTPRLPYPAAQVLFASGMAVLLTAGFIAIEPWLEQMK